jgi:preprotein translocase subunit SecB
MVPDVLQYRNDVSFGFNVSEDKKQLSMLGTIESKSEDGLVEIGVSYFVAVSKVQGEENMTFEEYANSGSPQALVYSYAREYLHNLTLKAGIPPLILVPANTRPTEPFEFGA